MISLMLGTQSTKIQRNRKQNGGYWGFRKGEKIGHCCLIDTEFHIYKTKKF